MKQPLFPRAAGLVILIACSWWALHAYDDFNSVSPIHWGLMAPWAVVGSGLPSNDPAVWEQAVPRLASWFMLQVNLPVRVHG